MRNLKFIAHIDYNFLQSREAKLMGDKNIKSTQVEFTLQDLVGYYREICGKKVFFPPNFTIRELLIPWLQTGNLPEIILDEKE